MSEMHSVFYSYCVLLGSFTLGSSNDSYCIFNVYSSDLVVMIGVWLFSTVNFH